MQVHIEDDCDQCQGKYQKGQGCRYRNSKESLYEIDCSRIDKRSDKNESKALYHSKPNPRFWESSSVELAVYIQFCFYLHKRSAGFLTVLFGHRMKTISSLFEKIRQCAYPVTVYHESTLDRPLQFPGSLVNCYACTHLCDCSYHAVVAEKYTFSWTSMIGFLDDLNRVLHCSQSLGLSS